MKLLRNSLILLFVLNAFLTTAQREEFKSIDVRKIESRPIVDGRQMFYSLPKNIVRIEITAKKTVQIAGPLSKYASKYLNITEGYITNDSEFYEIVDVNFNRISIPDSNQMYAIIVEDVFSLPNMQLNDDGVIKGVNLDYEVAGYRTETCRLIKPMDEAEEFYFYDFGVKNFLKEKTETFYRTVQTDSTPKRVSYEKTSLIPKTDEEIAEEVAALLRKIKKRRMKLLFNQIEAVNPNEGDALKISVKELKDQEDYYLSLFMGKTFTKTYKMYFDYIPDVDVPIEQEIIGYYSQNLGFAARKPDLRRSNYKPIVLKSTVISSQMNPKIKVIDDTGKTPVSINHGLYYRIPGRVDAVLEYDTEIIGRQQIQIAQKGIVVPMPAKYLNYNYGVEFYPETGGIKKIVKPKQSILNEE